MEPSRHHPGAGASLTELISVLMLIGVFMAIGAPALVNFYRTHQLRSASGMVRDLVRYTRIQALKEQTAYQILVHDLDASPSNTLEIQKDESGSWVTLQGQTHAVPEGVDILGSGSTDSLDVLTVKKRGACTSGNIYLQGQDGAVIAIDIEPSCYTSST